MILTFRPFAFAAFGVIAMPFTALAGNVADCQVVVIDYVKDDNGGGAALAKYLPAAPFLESVIEGDVIYEVDGLPIKGLLCRRNDVIPKASDWPVLESGVPFALSQDFDQPDTDSLTVFFKDGKFQYQYAGYPLSDEVKDTLDARMAAFNAKDHDLGEREDRLRKKSDDEEKAAAEDDEADEITNAEESTEDETPELAAENADEDTAEAVEKSDE